MTGWGFQVYARYIVWMLNQVIFLLNFPLCTLLLKFRIKRFLFWECQEQGNQCILVIHFQRFTICNPLEICSWNWVKNFWRKNRRFKIRVCSLGDGSQRIFLMSFFSFKNTFVSTSECFLMRKLIATGRFCQTSWKRFVEK